MRKRMPDMALLPADTRASIAVDLGAESCRISLLRWIEGKPEIKPVHQMIEAGLEHGLRQCAAIATTAVRSIAVDGWAVDYVRVGADGKALSDPFCYRDERTVKAERVLHRKISPERLRELTGVQLLRINTLYQLYADGLQGLP